MSKNQLRRQAIFEKYKANLKLLVDNHLIISSAGIYICPICLKKHKGLNEIDFLTLEDAPPKSLGGKANILTCKSCNNECGHKIDSHLANRLNEIDKKKLLPNTSVKVKTEIDGEIFNGTLSVDENGIMTMFHSTKNNNPNKLNPVMEKVGKDKIININFEKSTVIPEKLEYALLKSAYLILFEKTGYSLILDNCYDKIREQLLNPDERIYPEFFWFKNANNLNPGAYFVNDKGYECLFVIMNLNTGLTKHSYLIVLPVQINNIEDIAEKINVSINSRRTLKLYPINNKKQEYIDDIENIKTLFRWLEERKKVS